MKKFLLILLCLPFIGFGQDLRSFSKCDIIINQVLENTTSFIKDKKTPKPEFRFYLKNQRFFINWNEEKFSQWKIIDQKETQMIE
tara:strand:- start:372 stop:626 length:255 start_codon:yes stop_codon:yes gene_type:complete